MLDQAAGKGDGTNDSLRLIERGREEERKSFSSKIPWPETTDGGDGTDEKDARVVEICASDVAHTSSYHI